MTSRSVLPAGTARVPHSEAIGKADAGPLVFYSTDATIFGQGEAAGKLYLVEFGTVRVCQVTSDGRRQIDSFYFAGEVFGFEAGSEHGCYAESVDGCGIRVVHGTGGVAAHQLLQAAISSFANAQRHLLRLGRMNAVEKFASFLLDLYDRQESDGGVALQMQHCDIADYLGLTFETVSRVLRILKERGIVRVPSIDRIEIVDVAALEALGE